jgi:putrescine transport system ATP-binding protein
MSNAAPAPVSEFQPWTDPTAKPLIQFKNVTKRWGDFTAIDNLTIDIFPQEFFALLGPSGCGKTTMMRMLAGFETPSEGTILIDGLDVAGIPPNKRAVNMMFQSYALFPHLSVSQNIAFGLQRDKLPKAQIKARVEEMLKLVQLEQFSHRKPHQISGGQRQRVALARSLAKAPKLLLLDEPLGALDKKLRQDTQFELMDIQEKTGTTFVMRDHGKIIQVNPPAKIYEEPASLYVADFIGDVNLIKGTVVHAQEGQASIRWEEGQNALTGIMPSELQKNVPATLAVRPEKITISTEKPDDVPNSLKGKVLDIAYLGNMSTYVIETENGKHIKAQAANTRRVQRRKITWEDEVWLSFTATAGVVLDK